MGLELREAEGRVEFSRKYFASDLAAGNARSPVGSSSMRVVEAEFEDVDSLFKDRDFAEMFSIKAN